MAENEKKKEAARIYRDLAQVIIKERLIKVTKASP
jgi:hypothetical protein